MKVIYKYLGGEVMWTRGEIKQYAKDFLKEHYWKAFAVCLIAALLSGGGGSTGMNNSNIDNNNDSYYMNEQDQGFGFEMNVPSEDGNPIIKFVGNRFTSPLSFMARGVLPVIIIIFAVLLVTLGFAIEVGKSRFFLDGFKGDVRIGKLFSTFNSEQYLLIVKTQFLRTLYTFLWTLLFIIPGIIKSYEYKMVPYILAEEPTLSSKEAIQRSRDMTRGHKTDMFVLDLSFIGWYLLGSILLGIGILFVNPYFEASYARLYNILSGDNYDYYQYNDNDMMVE